MVDEELSSRNVGLKFVVTGFAGIDDLTICHDECGQVTAFCRLASRQCCSCQLLSAPSPLRLARPFGVLRAGTAQLDEGCCARESNRVVLKLIPILNGFRRMSLLDFPKQLTWMVDYLNHHFVDAEGRSERR